MSALAICASAALGDCRVAEHGQHHLWRQARARIGHRLQRALFVVGVPARRGFERGPHQLEQRGDAHADADDRSADSDCWKCSSSSPNFSGSLTESTSDAERAFVERAGIALQAERDDAIPLGLVAAGALAQHLGVVDLADLEVRSSASRPRRCRCRRSAMRSSGARARSRSSARQSSASASRWIVSSPMSRRAAATPARRWPGRAAPAPVRRWPACRGGRCRRRVRRW